MVYNERGAVLVGAVVTERIVPGALCIEHGARIDLAIMNGSLIDRGGCINLIAPSPSEKYKVEGIVKIPEMNVSGFLADIRRVELSELASLAKVMDESGNNRTPQGD
jgi:hypothetical protein